MDWVKALNQRWSLAQKEDPRTFGPGENASLYGTPNVSISGNEQKIFQIPGVEGSINLNVSVKAIKDALEGAFGGDFFNPITNIVIRPMAGKFGLTVSDHPHTIYINEEAMLEAVRNAVANEAALASQKGIKAKFTPEIGQRINTEIAKLLWETIPHERQHAVDFQAELHKLFTTGNGNVASVPEAHGEAAGKAALSKFKWYVSQGSQMASLVGVPKFASQIDAPPAMVKPILELVKAYKLNIRKNGGKEEGHILPVDLTGWRYGGEDLIQLWKVRKKENATKMNNDVLAPIMKSGTEEQKNIVKTVMDANQKYIDGTESPTIRLRIYSDYTNTPAAWQPLLETLSVSANHKFSTSELESFINHELRHFAQTFLSFVRTGKEQAKDSGVGMPSRHIRTPQHEQNADRANIQTYYLDDSEFYTILQDRIQTAVMAVKQSLDTPESRKNYFKRFINNDQFLLTLRQSAKGKYNKAISELWKAISQAPYPKGDGFLIGPAQPRVTLR